MTTARLLWITFHGETLWWAFLKPAKPVPYRDHHSVIRHVAGEWRSTDINGEPLSRDRLSGSLNKLSGYRGTSCRIEVEDYLIRRINGEKTPQVERAIAALDAMRASALEMMRLLEPRDFETLVDLMFSTSGWRRQGIISKTQKTLDLDLDAAQHRRARLRASEVAHQFRRTRILRRSARQPRSL